MTDPSIHVAAEMARVGASLVEQRCRQAMRAAGATSDDFRSGAVRSALVTNRDCVCHGTGVLFIWEKDKSFATVELCPCLEVRIVRIVDAARSTPTEKDV